MKLRHLLAVTSACLISSAVMANCKVNTKGQKFCAGDAVYTNHWAKARITGFDANISNVLVLEGADKGESHRYYTSDLYATKGCIIDVCIGSLVRPHNVSVFNRTVVGLNKVTNQVLYKKVDGTPNDLTPGELVVKPGTGRANTSENRWSVGKRINAMGVLQAEAYVQTSSEKTTLILACQAPVSDMKLKIKMDDVFYRAARYSVENVSESLMVTLKLGSQTVEITNFEFQEGNMIAQLDSIHPDDITSIKKGSDLRVIISTFDNNEQELVLQSSKFSLKGSSAAINSAHNYCQGIF